ncbi:putative Response regulator, CheY-like [Nitrospina gracilis 3/211]|uniref:Putative Response regulator, CheY-like n=1 Tax=Nitrospina gracilis (strain 3/211) TaxID=1266370 RepID=M1YW47_NITG3|nr:MULTISPECIES: response regulator [Nitrospina]MCF8722731.1 two-component system chemotaxis response regulator CheY [Nitrospina sp. Nb-3]CCQ89679.1 putative Response regulator, CheY-like [Nitrospina gracilis 3/211]
MSIMDDCAGTHGKILIIEDDPDIRDVLRFQLEQANYKVIEAANGEEAIDLMKKGSNLLQVGLILTDIRMPKINGVEAIEYIKANAPSIPILVVTGYPDTDLAVDLLRKGVKDFLVKPVEKETLLNKVAAILASPQEFKYA